MSGGIHTAGFFSLPSVCASLRLRHTVIVPHRGCATSWLCHTVAVPHRGCATPWLCHTVALFSGCRRGLGVAWVFSEKQRFFQGIGTPTPFIGRSTRVVDGSTRVVDGPTRAVDGPSRAVGGPTQAGTRQFYHGVRGHRWGKARRVFLTTDEHRFTQIEPKAAQLSELCGLSFPCLYLCTSVFICGQTAFLSSLSETLRPQRCTPFLKPRPVRLDHIVRRSDHIRKRLAALHEERIAEYAEHEPDSQRCAPDAPGTK